MGIKNMNVWRWRRFSSSIVWMLLVLTLLILTSCVNPISTPSVTPQPTRTIPTSPTPLTTASNPISNSPQLTQRYEFTAQDNGITITYVVTSRFEIILNQQEYPKKQVQISCTPQGTLGSVTNLPSEAPPFYAIRYQAVQPGNCTISNENFLLVVKIIALNK